MKDNERKINPPLPKTSWGTLTEAPAPQSVQQSNPHPSGKSLLNLFYPVKYSDELQSESAWYFQVIMSIRRRMSTTSRRFIFPKIYKSSRLMVGK
jgi:hypothetical protein